MGYYTTIGVVLLEFESVSKQDQRRVRSTI